MQDRKSTGVRRRQNNVSEKVAGHRRQMSHDPTDTQDTILHAESTEHLPLHGEHRLICVNSDLGIGRRKTTLLTRGRPICPRCRRSGRTSVRSPLATSSGSAIVSSLRGFVHQRGRGARGGSRSGNENGAGFALCPRDVLKERREHDSKSGSRWVSASGRGWPGTPSCLRVDTLEKHAPPGERRVSLAPPEPVPA